MKKEKMELECQECEKVFSRSTKTVFPKCPRCKSEDLYPTDFFGKKKKD
jgi:Zn finger protein HypA/HybF involved in hydrogenase expression